MFTIYDKAGNEHIMLHGVDVIDALKTGRFFKDPPSVVADTSDDERPRSIPTLSKLSKQELVDHARSRFGIILNIQDLRSELLLAINDLENKQVSPEEEEEEEEEEGTAPEKRTRR